MTEHVLVLNECVLAGFYMIWLLTVDDRLHLLAPQLLLVQAVITHACIVNHPPFARLLGLNSALRLENRD